MYRELDRLKINFYVIPKGTFLLLFVIMKGTFLTYNVFRYCIFIDAASQVLILRAC